MEKKGVLTRILTITGSFLVFFPLIAAVATSRFFDGIYRIDYLIPFELFPIFLIGALLLVWAAFRTHEFRRLIGWSLIAIFAIIAAGALYTQLSGLASGETEPTKTIEAIGLVVVIVFCLLEVGIGVSGILLIRKAFAKNGKVSA